MTTFIPGGPERYRHQKMALTKMIRTGGVTSLLFDPGTGKALDLSTEVPTPEGWTTMGELRTGDTVYAPDGTETRIIAHEPYEAETWRLTFSGSVEVIADGDHLWQVETRTPGGRMQPSATRTTREMVDTLTVGGKSAHLVRMIEPVEGQKIDLPIDPYVLGVWLGDGSSASGSLSLGEQDAEFIVTMLREAGEHPRITRTDRGASYVTLGAREDECRYGHVWPGANCPQCSHLYYRREKYGEPMTPVNVSLKERLRDLGVLGDKHIPAAYLRASAEQRLNLLRGIVDTDGYLSRDGALEVTLTNERLARGVHEVVASLGERVTLTEERATLNGRDVGPRWRLRWTSRLHQAALLPRRVVQPHPDSTRLRGRYLVSAEPAGRRLVRCLTVDSPTAQYLVTRSWLPTHNTAPTLDYISLLALKAAPRSVAGGSAVVQEARVLVVAPLAAVDTWVLQARSFLSPQVDYWAEALGGSLVQRAEALAARGGNGFKGTEHFIKSGRGKNRVERQAPLRALHFSRSIAWGARSTDREVIPADGPDGVRGKPRVVLEVLNLDTFSSRLPYRNGTMADLMLDAVKRFSPDLVVVDESHRIRGASSNVSRLLGRVAEHAPRRIILTGTVMPTSALDVFGQWRFLEPYAFGHRDGRGVDRRATYGGFKDRFAQMGGYMGREVVGFKNLDEMQDIMARNAVVARKKDVLDLPSTTEVIVPVHLSAAEQRAYADMKAQLATMLTDGTTASTTNRLAQMMRLRQITSGHLPDDNGTVRTLGTAKADTIKSIVEDTLAGEKRIVIFCQFTHEIEMLARRLVKPGTEIMKIAGGTSSEDRQRMRKRFGVDPHEPGSPEPGRMVIIAQIRTMSLAVNELVTANHAIFGSLSQMRDDLVQARDRLNRIGQENPSTFWYALAPKTIDDVIFKSHEERTNLEDAVLQHILGEA